MKKKGYIGIELGQDTLKIARVICKKDKMILEYEKVMHLKGGCIEDGMLMDEHLIYEMINDVIQENKIEEKLAYVVMKSGAPVIRTIPLKKEHKKKQLRNLPGELKVRFPVDLEKYWTQLKVVEIDEKEHSDQAVIMALPALNMLRVIYILKKLGLKCLKLTLFSEVIREMVKKVEPNILFQTIGVLVVEEHSAYITIMENGVGIINKNIVFQDQTNKIREVILEIERIKLFYSSHKSNCKIQKIYLRAQEDTVKFQNYLEEILKFEVVSLPYIESKESDYMCYFKNDIIDFARGSASGVKESNHLRRWGLMGLECTVVMIIVCTSLYNVSSRTREYTRIKNEIKQPHYKIVRDLKQSIRQEQQLLEGWCHAVRIAENQKGVEESIIDMVTSNIPDHTKIELYSFENNSVYLQGVTAGVSGLQEMIGYFKESYPSLTVKFQVEGIESDSKVPFTLVILLENREEKNA